MPYKKVFDYDDHLSVPERGLPLRPARDRRRRPLGRRGMRWSLAMGAGMAVGIVVCVLIGSLLTALFAITGLALVCLRTWAVKGTVPASALADGAREMAVLEGFIKAGEDYVPSWQDPHHPLYDPAHPDFVTARPAHFVTARLAQQARQPQRRKLAKDPVAAQDMRKRVRTRRIDALQRVLNEMEDISRALSANAFDCEAEQRLGVRFEMLKDKYDRLYALVDEPAGYFENLATPGKLIVLDGGVQVHHIKEA